MTPRDVLEAAAQARHEACEHRPSHRPLSDGYELVGVRGEKLFADTFGLTDQLRFFEDMPGGDGGYDFVVLFRVSRTKRRKVTVDVKSSRKPIHLPVEVGHERAGLYVLAGIDDVRGDCLVGWATRAQLMAAPLMVLPGTTFTVHAIHRRKLHSIRELRERLQP